MLDLNLLQHEFPQDEGLCYLNHAAVAPWPARTAEAVRRFAEENISKGAKDYANWLTTEKQLRKQLQSLIHAPSINDIALLKNTSEGISIVACGIDWRPGENIVSSNEEFPSNRIPWEAQQDKGVEFRKVAIQVDDPEQALIDACDENTRLLTISSVQYATGRRMDLVRLGKHCTENNILFCVDAIQSLGALEMDAQAIHADFMMADGHKWMLGPEGIALFFCTETAREHLTLNQYGWHMVEKYGDYDTKEWTPASSARKFECGSNNLMGIHALSASLSLFEDVGMGNVEQQVLGNSIYLMECLKQHRQIQFLSPVGTGEYA
ncbi:MAG: aminotransferase class V-fold PLP-dependent enzyme, partial [Gammaproteobacteria bacterium]|nr:aminotransferase class V-fold PLP-dependent enzyme [Gammaproteobacteria bacterium]